MDIVKEISKKGFDAARIARYAIENPPCIDPLIKGIRAPKGSVRFAYEKVLRLISEQRPDLVYPYWNVFRELSVCDNSILKWGAILILSHLAVVDEDKRLDAVLEEYYAPIQGPMMITAGNIIRGSVTIAAAKPYLIRRITREILRVEEGQYESHGEPSPECRNVAIGHAIDALDQLFDR
ncbi:MAG: hypothetical protein JXA82_01385, partial [Sedimentisphaerales bacterium]|nr:hypothetical protein [Sedimentisphaerales bacterium]